MTNSPKIGPMLRLVLGVGALAQPLAKPLLKRRLAKGKEDPQRWLEKLGQTNAPRPDGTLIWMHGVGVGEVMALRGLIAALSATRPDLEFLVTSSARSSGNVFAKNLPPRTRHQYLPLDLPGPVAAFLDHWRPNMAIWSDQEIWPRLAVSTARRAIPQALIAARITERSATAKARFGQAYGDLYRLLDTRHAQDDATADHLRTLMDDGTPVHVTGSLKAAAAPLADDPDARTAVTNASGRRIWTAASAHMADVEIALAAHPRDTLLIIAPRDLANATQIAQRCDDAGLTWAQRSTGDLPDPDTQVYIADTYGELGLWYRAAFVALIGGTFDNTEGHNPWEAVALECPVIHGTRTGNFTADFVALIEAEAAWYIPPNDMQHLEIALADPNLPSMATRASAVRNSATDGLTKITADLLALLNA